jgi:hypothetical protein
MEKTTTYGTKQGGRREKIPNYFSPEVGMKWGGVIKLQGILPGYLE